jgi:outer membrane receptor protein involved in Fe transport
VGTELRFGALSLLAHGGAVARAPSFVERYGDPGLFLGKADLQPESARTVDAGARVATKRARAELVGFATWAHDLITFVPEGAYGRERATNIGRARMLGLEADAWGSALGFELRASWTALATADESTCAATSGAIGGTECARPSLVGRPTSDLVTDLAYRAGPARVRIGIDAVSGIQADRVGAVIVPPRVLASAGARVDVPGVPGLRIALDVRNALDVRTATYDGALGPVREPIGDLYEYPLPGRTVLASVRWTERPEPRANDARE